ncbi:MAG: hypothetical protein ACREI8_15870 [Myxococcota bacterium]
MTRGSRGAATHAQARASNFKDGAPTKETPAKVFDNLDMTYAFRAFTDTMSGVSIHALNKAGVALCSLWP